MDNTKLPAYPQDIAFHSENDTPQTTWGLHPDFSGFTKLELASLMMAAAYAPVLRELPDESIAEFSVKLAKVVLEEANK